MQYLMDRKLLKASAKSILLYANHVFLELQGFAVNILLHQLVFRVPFACLCAIYIFALKD